MLVRPDTGEDRKAARIQPIAERFGELAVLVVHDDRAFLFAADSIGQLVNRVMNDPRDGLNRAPS
jgi:hypothetical protein